MRTALDAAAVAARLASVPGWRLDGGRLAREFVFRDFAQAFGFMAQVALIAERLDHHPDWSNAWNRVTVHLTTHDAGGLTERDFALAERMNAVFGETR